MKEIGGYFELDCAGRNFLHEEGVWLNSGRNALRYIVRAYGIRKINVPYFTCPVIWKALREEGCDISFYEVGRNLCPLQRFNKNDYILYTNYFGVCGDKVRALAVDYPNLIVDNAQALYTPPCGLASFYSPRKFFGLPDGGIVMCDNHIELPAERDLSAARMTHLLTRIDTGDASSGYADFKAANASLTNAPILRMSRLTEALMGNLDVDFVKRRRLENVKVLQSDLPSSLVEEMAMDDVPLVYPFYTENAEELRQKLIANKIYVATYWPEIERNLELCKNILALPMDQRYGAEDMRRIIGIISRSK